MIKKVDRDDLGEFADDEYCEHHGQDANICEEKDDNSESSEFAVCRRLRYDLYIRGDLSDAIVDAAKKHFRAQSN